MIKVDVDVIYMEAVEGFLVIMVVDRTF